MKPRWPNEPAWSLSTVTTGTVAVDPIASLKYTKRNR